jgi:hypothetical protein
MDSLIVDKLKKRKLELQNQIRNATKADKVELIKEAKTVSMKLKELDPKRQEQVKKQIEKEKLYDSVECAECNQPYKTSNKTRVPVAFCKPCRKIRGKDLLTLIRFVHKSKKVQIEVVNYSDQDIAEKQLSMLTSDLRLDLHKTLDTISPSIKFPMGYVCCVSYVGRLTKTRIEAQRDIINRMQKNQITFGALVYNRGSEKSGNRNDFTEPGGKAWFNRLVNSNISEPLFVDDSEDHVLSVRSIGVRSIQIKPQMKLLKLLE